MQGKGVQMGLVLLFVLVGMIVILQHIHTEYSPDSSHASHSSLKSKSLELNRNRGSSDLVEGLSNISLLRTERQIAGQGGIRPTERIQDKIFESAQKVISNASTISLTRKPTRSVIFTMNTIPSYEQNSRSGGASGELVIRYALEEVLKENGVSVHVVRSDFEFDRCQMDSFDIILLDSWTWAMKGWVPKRNIRGHERKIYILDFFGAQSMRGNSLNISPKQILTAFKSPWNSFLGYYIHPDRIEKLRPSWEKKLKQGVIWGKDPKHYDNKHGLIQKVADISPLISTSTIQVELHDNIKWVGHLTSGQWFEHLASSKFLLGLGNPLLGPSAIDAVSLGCMFIDPNYKTAVHNAGYISQHPYLHTAMPEYVCSYNEGNVVELTNCVNKALATNLSPKIPDELTREAYVNRVKEIFKL
jgi:CheY-like chemotaxis protein